MERRSRKQGSGIGPEVLRGIWRLKRVWRRGQRSAAGLNSALLRSLSASLTIIPDSDENQLILMNSIQLGALELRFEGHGRLQGPRPLLMFQFDRLILKLGQRELLVRSLPHPQPLKQPFFALISAYRTNSGDSVNPRGNGVDWLAARGRSGGIALWELEVSQPC